MVAFPSICRARVDSTAMKTRDPSPRVSVLMAVYNGERFVKQAVQSVLEQTCQRWELIIVDDCSTDGTFAILEEYALTHPAIHLLKTGTNKGQTFCLNYGLARARGEYLARLDADDLMVRDRLEKQVQFLDDHPGVVLVGSFVETIENTLESNNERNCIYSVPCGNAALRKAFKRINPFFHSSVMVRTAQLKLLGGYDPAFHFAQDYELWLRIARMGEIANLPTVLTRYRVLSSSISRTSNRTQSLEFLRIQLRSVWKGWLTPSTLIHMWRPLTYILAPRLLVEWRFRYREQRDLQSREYYLR